MMPAALESSHELAGDERAAQPDKSPKPLAVLKKKKIKPLFQKICRDGMLFCRAKQKRGKRKERISLVGVWLGGRVYTIDAHGLVSDHNPGWLATEPASV